jgi:hypothetical protein
VTKIQPSLTGPIDNLVKTHNKSIQVHIDQNHTASRPLNGPLNQRA